MALFSAIHQSGNDLKTVVLYKALLKLIVFAIVISACAPSNGMKPTSLEFTNPNSEGGKGTATLQPTPTILNTPLPGEEATIASRNLVSTPTSTPTNTPNSIDLSSIEGDFIIMDRQSGLYLTPTDLSSYFEISSYTNQNVSITSSLDGNRIVTVPKEPGTRNVEISLLDRFTEHKVSTFDNPGCVFPTLSPLGDQIAFACYTSEMDLRVYIYDFDKKIGYLIQNGKDQFLSPGGLSWSPDGKWLAYINGGEHAEPIRAKDGLYLIDTSCFQKPKTCPEKTFGPYLNKSDIYKKYLYNPAWSPDSGLVAVVSDDLSIVLFDVLSRKTLKSFDMPIKNSGANIFFSPDGEKILIDQENLYFLKVSDGSLVKREFQGSVIQWIRKINFRIGRQLIISPIGQNLNFRETPSLQGKLIKKLQAGDKVQIVDGPVKADGYRWWKFITLPDNIEGWLVEIPTWYKPAK